MNRHIAIGLAVAGALTWFFPGFNGFLFSPSDVSVGHGRIIASILLVGAAIVWHLRPSES